MKKLLVGTAVLVLMVASTIGLVAAARADEVARQDDQEALVHRENLLQGELAHALMDELATAIAVHVGDRPPSALEEATEQRLEAHSKLSEHIRVAGSAEEGELRERFESLLVDIETYDTAQTDYEEIFEAVSELIGRTVGISQDDPQLRAQADLIAISLAPRFVLDTVLGVELPTSGIEPPANSGTYWLPIGDDGPVGWNVLGPSDAEPLPPQYSEGKEIYAKEYEQMASALVESRLYAYDAWIGEGARGDAPLTRQELLVVVDREATSFQSLVTTATERTLLEQQLAVERQRTLRPVYLIGGILGLLLAAFVLLSEGMGALRSRKRLVAASLTDPLTGAGNRRNLETTVPKLLGAPQYEHHIIAMIDLDRFKMVNDMWGHSAGDTALIAVVSRLESALKPWMMSGDRASSVVRLGGDEFIVTLHSDERIDTAVVDRMIRAEVERSLDVGAETELEIGISLGFANCSGAEGLEEAMQVADLAVYENKASRFSDSGNPERDQPVEATPAALSGGIPTEVDLT